MEQIETVKDLKTLLNDIPDNAVPTIGVWNGYNNTYAKVDSASLYVAENIHDDMFGTRGNIDKRLMLLDEKTPILYLGTFFHKNTEDTNIAYISDPNEPIEFINGKEGDHDLFWKSNGFIPNDDGTIWTLEEEAFKLTYTKENHNILVETNKYQFNGECIGLEDFFEIMNACKIDNTWRIG